MPVEAPVIRNTGSSEAMALPLPRMLADRARIEVRAGGGGNGCLSFRREAHVPKGGPGRRRRRPRRRRRAALRRLAARPAVLQAPRALPRRPRRARPGRPAPRRRRRADGRARAARARRSTKWDGTRYDLVRPGQEVTVAARRAGRARQQAVRRAPTRQAPRLAERGLPGEEGAVELHLKLLADVGLVGLPNAGKSSLLATHDARGARRSPPTRSRRSSRCSARSTPTTASS